MKPKMNTSNSSSYSIKKYIGFTKVPITIWLEPKNYSEGELVEKFIDKIKSFKI